MARAKARSEELAEQERQRQAQWEANKAAQKQVALPYRAQSIDERAFGVAREPSAASIPMPALPTFQRTTAPYWVDEQALGAARQTAPVFSKPTMQSTIAAAKSTPFQLIDSHMSGARVAQTPQEIAQAQTPLRNGIGFGTMAGEIRQSFPVQEIQGDSS